VATRSVLYRYRACSPGNQRATTEYSKLRRAEDWIWDSKIEGDVALIYPPPAPWYGTAISGMNN